jgi:ribose 1,5-bisphosphokinase PhnN
VTDLRHVLWIGGPSSSGKTTIARALARRYGLRLYSSDTRTWEHRDRAIARGHEAAIRWESLTPEERWIEASTAEMFAMSLHHERGEMIVEDIRGLPTSPLVVVEGTPVAPSLVSSGVAPRTRAVWLLPTPEFREARLAERGGERPADRLYDLIGEEITREAYLCDVPTLVVDGTRDLSELIALVEGLFADTLADGPRADRQDERRALLRAANRDIVAQCVGYLARPWSTLDPDAMRREFLCECDDPDCGELVELRVAAFPSSDDERVLAPGHG